ncbi:DUF2218 domain-containing protein [Pseudomonas psychrophila]|uniref:DUF2218 domain-containing protein n=1 Tax=Pseudomonas psychrophila TaxID=122355 RepID=UPI003810A759
MFVSTAQIATDNLQRLITRLCKHWGHKFPVSFEALQGEIQLGLGRCLLQAQDNALDVRLNAADDEQLQRMTINPLPTFDWQRQA